MATITNVLLVDDLDGSTAEDTISFGLDGQAYEIDLNGKNAGKLRDSLARYVEHARRASNGQAPKGRKGKGSARSIPAARFQTANGSTPLTPADRAALREWAAGRGIEVKERGRIAATVVAEWRAATGGRA